MKKRTYLLLVIAILAATVLGMLVVEHQGYVLITWKNVRYESTLWIFLAVLAALALLASLARGLAALLLRSLGWVNPWSARNRRKRLDEAADRGLLEFNRGNWQAALKHLEHAGKVSERPLPYLLAAARSADKLGQHQQADDLLAQAGQRLKGQDPAISLCQADLHIQRGQLLQARDCLQEARSRHPGNSELLERLLELLLQQQDWSSLTGLLPDLRKARLRSSEELDSLEQQTWQGRLQQAEDARALEKTWAAMSSTLHQSPGILLAYCSRLIVLGQARDAEALLRRQLDKNMDSQLLQAWSQIPHADATRALQTARNWQAQMPDDPHVLLALGKLAIQANEWAAARDYLQASLSRQPTAQAYAELARLLGRMGDHKAGNELLDTSIRLLEQQSLSSTH